MKGDSHRNVLRLFAPVALLVLMSAFIATWAAMRPASAGAFMPPDRAGPEAGQSPCCDVVTATIQSSCVPTNYRYSYTLSNTCSETVRANGCLCFQVAPTENGPWTTAAHADYLDRPIKPGVSHEGGAIWFGPLPTGNYWFRNRIYLLGCNFFISEVSAPLPACVLSTGTPASTATSTATRTPTGTPTMTAITSPTSTPTPCPMMFTDVQAADYFYSAVRYLYCKSAVSGYADNTFLPYNNTTRAQLCKIVVLAEEWDVECPEAGRFSDVQPGNPFFCFVETAYEHGAIWGYADGTFRPGNDVTRAQLCKVAVLAEGWELECPAQPHFGDGARDNAFYCYVETAYARGIISGYADGAFRPGNSATRGQICKIVYQAITRP